MTRMALYGMLTVVLMIGLAVELQGQETPVSDAFFPIGMYCVEDPSELRELAQAGFNLIQGYRFEGAYPDQYPDTLEAAWEYLEAAYQVGLRVLMGIPQEAVLNKDLAIIQERVNALKDHPALFGWQLYDEPEGPDWDDLNDPRPDTAVPPENLRVAYHTIKQLDPIHPVSSANSFPADERYPYSAWVDIVMPDYFPIPGELFGPIEEIANYIVAPLGKRVIPHIQAYNLSKDDLIWGTLLPSTPKSAARYPTRDEMRFLAYYSLIQGADGVIFSCYRYDYGEGRGGDDISRKNNPSQWQRVSSVASELKAMSPILLVPTAEPEEAGATLIGEGPVELLVKSYQGKIYVFTANPTPDSVEQSFWLDPKRFPQSTITLLPGRRRLPLHGNTLTDRWQPYEVRIYEIAEPSSIPPEPTACTQEAKQSC